jgi:nickel/cobalt exporter
MPWRSLLTLGVSGGILPSPSALLVLLAAVYLHRLAFGLLLIFAFSLGMATVMMGVGLAFVLASRYLGRLPAGGRVLTLAPLAGAAGIMAVGAFLAASAAF